jgi:hypothetical protein
MILGHVLPRSEQAPEDNAIGSADQRDDDDRQDVIQLVSMSRRHSLLQLVGVRGHPLSYLFAKGLDPACSLALRLISLRCIPVAAIGLEGRQRRVDVVVEYIRMAEIIGFDAAMALRRLLKKPPSFCAEKCRLIRPRNPSL